MLIGSKSFIWVWRRRSGRRITTFAFCLHFCWRCVRGFSFCGPCVRSSWSCSSARSDITVLTLRLHFCSRCVLAFSIAIFCIRSSKNRANTRRDLFRIIPFFLFLFLFLFDLPFYVRDGIALEILWPSPNFQPSQPRPSWSAIFSCFSCSERKSSSIFSTGGSFSAEASAFPGLFGTGEVRCALGSVNRTSWRAMPGPVGSDPPRFKGWNGGGEGLLGGGGEYRDGADLGRGSSNWGVLRLIISTASVRPLSLMILRLPFVRLLSRAWYESFTSSSISFCIFTDQHDEYELTGAFKAYQIKTALNEEFPCSVFLEEYPRRSRASLRTKPSPTLVLRVIVSSWGTNSDGIKSHVYMARVST